MVLSLVYSLSMCHVRYFCPQFHIAPDIALLYGLGLVLFRGGIVVSVLLYTCYKLYHSVLFCLFVHLLQSFFTITSTVFYV